MILSATIDRNLRRTLIEGASGDYDSAVVAPVMFHDVPLARDVNRLAVAYALLFHDQISGELVIKDTEGCARHVGLEIARFFSPVDVIVTPQALKPAALPKGNLKAVVPVSGVCEKNAINIGHGDLSLRFLFGVVGAIHSTADVAIGTNLLPYSPFDDNLQTVLKLLGGCALFAEDLQLRGIHLTGLHKESSGLERACALLNSVGLALTWELVAS